MLLVVAGSAGVRSVGGMKTTLSYRVLIVDTSADDSSGISDVVKTTLHWRVLVVAASAGDVHGVGHAVKPTLPYRVLVVAGFAGDVGGGINIPLSYTVLVVVASVGGCAGNGSPFSPSCKVLVVAASADGDGKYTPCALDCRWSYYLSLSVSAMLSTPHSSRVKCWSLLLANLAVACTSHGPHWLSLPLVL